MTCHDSFSWKITWFPAILESTLIWIPHSMVSVTFGFKFFPKACVSQACLQPVVLFRDGGNLVGKPMWKEVRSFGECLWKRVLWQWSFLFLSLLLPSCYDVSSLLQLKLPPWCTYCLRPNATVQELKLWNKICLPYIGIYCLWNCVAAAERRITNTVVNELKSPWPPSASYMRPGSCVFPYTVF